MSYVTDETLAGVATWRVYFNRQGTRKEAFSVDRGAAKPRRHFRHLTISTGAAEAYFHATGKEPDGINPIAWIEIYGELHAFQKPSGTDALILGAAPPRSTRK